MSRYQTTDSISGLCCGNRGQLPAVAPFVSFVPWTNTLPAVQTDEGCIRVTTMLNEIDMLNGAAQVPSKPAGASFACGWHAAATEPIGYFGWKGLRGNGRAEARPSKG